MSISIHKIIKSFFLQNALQYFSQILIFEGKTIMIDPHSFSSEMFKNLGGLKLWEARHSMVLNFIEEKNIQTMIDFGTNEATLLQKVQRGIQVKRLIGVDIDPEIMQKAIQNLKPQSLQYDMQFIRQYEQLVSLYHGSALQKYTFLKNLKPDLITLVQVIEHIQEKHLPQLNQNIFGYLKPTFVFMSTPNSDFNPAFKWENGKKFRHDDHKFQWTRREFSEYVKKVSQRFNYRATITGVGEALAEEHWDKGYCSQVAIFENLDNSQEEESIHDLSFHLMQEQLSQDKSHQNPTIPLKLIYSHTNHYWQSQQQHLIQIVLKQLIHLCQSNQGFLPWSKVISQLLKKRIIKMLSRYNLEWNNDAFLRKFVCDMFVGRSDVVCEDNGMKVVREGNIVREEKSMVEEEMEMEIRRENGGFLDGMNIGTENEEIKNESDLVIYTYDDLSLLTRQRRNTKKQKSNTSKKYKNASHKSLSSSEFSSTSQQSSSVSNQSSNNSWQSIELPQNEVPKRVTKKKRIPFKPQRPILVKEEMNNSLIDNVNVSVNDNGQK